jgi:predicted MFS family arabinose efflux permease
LVTNEFLPIGLLVDMHRDLHVSEGVAGLTMTVPAVVAAPASPGITIGTGRLDRRRLLPTAMALGAVLAALALGTFVRLTMAVPGSPVHA